jgi:hypothetical protein
MANRIADEHHRKTLARFAQPCVDTMREAARGLGYALATHGTMAFDIDVVAIPWIDGAAEPEALIAGLREACSRVTEMPTYF